MFATAENKVTPVYVSPYPDDRAWVVDILSVSWDGLGLVYAFPPAPIVPKTLKKMKDSHDTTVILIASQHPSRPWHPMLLQLSLHPPILLTNVALFQYIPNIRRPQFHRQPCLLDLTTWLLSRDIIKQHNFPDTVVDMAANPLRGSSSNVYNSQWKAFAKWANDKGIQSKDLSYVTLVEYLIHLFTENKQVNTIKDHRASIASVLKMLNPPTVLQEDTIHNIIRKMSILRPRTQEVLPRWHLSVVLKVLMKPPFAINSSDRNLSLKLLSYKTAFLVALATGARGSELVALSRVPHNLDLKTLDSGAKQVSIWMVPKFIPKNQRPELIPKPLEFPGIAHLFPKDLERLLCPVRVLGLYLLRSAEERQLIHNKNFLCISLQTPSSSLPTSDAG